MLFARLLFVRIDIHTYAGIAASAFRQSRSPAYDSGEESKKRELNLVVAFEQKPLAPLRISRGNAFPIKAIVVERVKVAVEELRVCRISVAVAHGPVVFLIVEVGESTNSVFPAFIGVRHGPRIALFAGERNFFPADQGACGYLAEIFGHVFPPQDDQAISYLRLRSQIDQAIGAGRHTGRYVQIEKAVRQAAARRDRRQFPGFQHG
jgi:hypothetical protein